METIRLEALTIGYTTGKCREYAVAADIQATLQSGELTCLLGENGVGKSTLLRTLSAFQPPLKGRIYIEQDDISTLTNKQLSQKIGVVLTSRPDVRNMTAREMVGMGRSPYTGFWGALTKDDERVVDQALEMTGTKSLERRMIQTLSDGERQKIMIAKALAQQTSVIFLDEPTAFLDYPSKVDMLQLLRELAHQEGKTIFLSTHDVELALQLSDTIWLMDKKRGLVCGDPRQLALEGAFNHYFRREDIIFDPETLTIRIK